MFYNTEELSKLEYNKKRMMNSGNPEDESPFRKEMYAIRKNIDSVIDVINRLRDDMSSILVPEKESNSLRGEVSPIADRSECSEIMCFLIDTNADIRKIGYSLSSICERIDL